VSVYSGRFGSGPERRTIDNMPDVGLECERIIHALTSATFAVYALAIATTAGVIVLALK
jgi:hypothetical protein